MTRAVRPPATRVCEVRRQRALDGTPLYLLIYGLGRKARFSPVEHLPPFEGDRAWFEVTPKPKTRLGHVFLRQVDQPDRPVHWTS